MNTLDIYFFISLILSEQNLLELVKLLFYALLTNLISHYNFTVKVFKLEIGIIKRRISVWFNLAFSFQEISNSIWLEVVCLQVLKIYDVLVLDGLYPNIDYSFGTQKDEFVVWYHSRYFLLYWNQSSQFLVWSCLLVEILPTLLNYSLEKIGRPQFHDFLSSKFLVSFWFHSFSIWD